jgi:hypothetical protein
MSLEDLQRQLAGKPPREVYLGVRDHQVDKFQINLAANEECSADWEGLFINTGHIRMIGRLLYDNPDVDNDVVKALMVGCGLETAPAPFVPAHERK